MSGAPEEGHGGQNSRSQARATDCTCLSGRFQDGALRPFVADSRRPTGVEDQVRTAATYLTTGLDPLQPRANADR